MLATKRGSKETSGEILFLKETSGEILKKQQKMYDFTQNRT